MTLNDLEGHLIYLSRFECRVLLSIARTDVSRRKRSLTEKQCQWLSKAVTTCSLQETSSTWKQLLESLEVKNWNGMIPLSATNTTKTSCDNVLNMFRLFWLRQLLHGILNLWRPLLPYVYSYKASCARQVKPSFVIFDIRALWASECPDVKNYK